jgi:uncharacterized protein YceK
MRRTKVVVLLLVSLLSGCSATRDGASTRVDPSAPARFKFAIADQPERNEFSVRLVSEDDRDLCLPVEEWPNARGQLSAGADRARVRLSSGEVRPMVSGVSMYCPGGCGTVRIKAGSALAGVVTYDVFGLWNPAEASAEKILEMEVAPSVCGAPGS